MPGGVHGLDDTPTDELPTFAAAWGKQHTEVMLTILPALKLKKSSFRKWLKALSTHKAVGMPDLAAGVDNLLVQAKAFLATLANSAA